MDESPLLYRVEESAKQIRVSRTRMFELIASGEIPTVQIGRSRRVPRAALEGYVARLSASTSAA